MRFAPVALVLLADGLQTSAFVAPSGKTAVLQRNPDGSAGSCLQLFGVPEPLATEGDWTAFLDEETTGLIYYFNSKTGESVWEAPTSTFPQIQLSSDKIDVMMDKRKEFQASQAGGDEAPERKGGGGIFGSIFGGSEDDSAAVVEEESKVEETVAEESAASMELEKKKRKGFFSSILKSLEEGEMPKSSFENEPEPVEEPLEAELVEDAIPEKKAPAFSFTKAFAGMRATKVVSKGVVAEELVIEEGMSVEDEDMPDEMVEEAMKLEKSSLFPDVMSVFKAKPKEADIIVPSEKTIEIETASIILPSPEKVSWGGEDACFVKGRTFGIFDGVSGADKLDGIPLYSETLSRQLQKTLPETGLTVEEMTMALTDAAEFADVAATGASTALVASIGEDGYLRALNIGDCVAVVFRDDGRVAARTKEIVHYFECPYQLGEDSPDRPIDGTTLKAEILPGDIIVAGSDGIFDNLRDDEIWDLVDSRARASIIAKKIINESRTVSLDAEAPTPYAKLAEKYKYEDYKTGLGGKVDDISCVVVRCT